MKVLVKIKTNRLEFLNKKRLNAEYKNMLNTNVIAHDELVFSDEYVTENEKIVASFLEGLIKIYHLDTVSFQNNEIAYIFLPLVVKYKNINKIIFEDEETIPYKLAEYIKESLVKEVSASYIPQYIFEMLDKKGIKSESRNEILFFSKFMTNNNLLTYSSIYYKSSINIDTPLLEDDITDFITFIKINKSLKQINLSQVNQNDLEQITDILKEYSKKNIKIVINSDVSDLKTIEFLKKLNDNLKKNKTKIVIKYSQEYLQKNLIKETNNKILKSIALIILFICSATILFITYDNYQSVMKVKDIQEKIENVIENNDPTEEIEKIENESGLIVSNDFIASLKKINEDTVAWLKVNNTNINYAVVQGQDNDYYLTHNIYKEKESSGWLFMDYENNTRLVDENIVIYGHNYYVNGVMFGTLRNALKKEWYLNPDNQIISLDTLFGSYKYQIFSIYIIPTTGDYIKTHFLSANDKLAFVQKIKDRSIYDFDIPVNEYSKILTLSTCQSDSTRLVVHAALVE